MPYTDTDKTSTTTSSSSSAPGPHFKSIVPAPHSCDPSTTRYISSCILPPLTPGPSPTMRPEDPKYHSSSGRAPIKNPSSGSQLPSLSDFHKPANLSHSPSSTRPLHSLYPAGTPPMTPGNPLTSPVARRHSGTTDPSQYSSGFYQLPPPLQPFAPPRQSPHQSPALPPQSNHGHSHPLPSLTSLSSPRSTPQMSPLSNHYLVSPALGPLSPYPTPQHHPRRYSSPHQDPLTPSKQAIPTMILPASALSTDSTFSSQPLHQELSPRTCSSVLTQPQKDFKLDSHVNSDTSIDTTAVDRTNSVPGSPRRFMMLPPQSPPTPSSSSQRTRSSQSRKSSTSSSSGTTSKRRSTSHNKVVDQETRELMRKVSHSAIERRRRERINDKILQLKHLVPSCVDEDHLHKLSILQSTIEYIQYLKSVLPTSVANAKVGKATNNNPNNKTTDMLEAMGGSISTKSPLTPLMTTGLNHIYTKRIKLEKQEIKRILEDPSSVLSAKRSRNRTSVSSSSSSSSSVASPLSPDEDAKDGLLMLAGQKTTCYEPHKRELRKRNSQYD